MVVNVEKKLQANVLDDVKYSKNKSEQLCSVWLSVCGGPL